jgi:1,4-alpha-glucan branching enzyme
MVSNPQSPVQPVSERFPALEEQEIILTCYAPDAEAVTVAGNFNNWQPEATPLKSTGSGKWVVRLKLRSGQYEYLFVVDGKWSEDPQAALRVPNPYGAFNSALLVPLDARTSIL